LNIEIEDITKSNCQNSSNLNSLREKLSIEAENKILTSQIIEYSQSLSQYYEEIDELKKLNGKYLSELSCLKTNISSREKDNYQLKKSCDLLEKDAVKEKSEVDRLLQNKIQLENEKLNIENLNSQMESEHSSLSKNLNILKSEYNQMHEKKKQRLTSLRNTYLNDIQYFEKENLYLNEKNIKINTTLTQNQYEVERVKNFVSDNEKEIESFHNKISNIEELDTQVKFLEGSLISKEKKFKQRTTKKPEI